MARIAGVDLNNKKRVEIALTAIYGIGLTSSREILERNKIDPGTKVAELTEAEIRSLRETIENDFKVEGALRQEVQFNIKRLMDLGTYKGLRHRRGLPVRGQRTSTNARTRKGKKGRIGGKKR